MCDLKTTSVLASAARLRFGLRTLLVLLAVTLVGCGTMDKETEHRILTFFFTGVPPLEQEHGAESAGLDGPVAGVADASEPASGTTSAEPQLWVHGPVAANQCDLCHTVAIRQGFSSVSVEGAEHRLVMPVEELCVSCHETKGAAAAQAQGLRMHAPVEEGLCIHCHEPHKSKRRFLLRATDNRALCTGCHDIDGLSQTDAHIDADMDCVACHNPHMGTTSTMLRMDFDEAVDR